MIRILLATLAAGRAGGSGMFELLARGRRVGALGILSQGFRAAVPGPALLESDVAGQPAPPGFFFGRRLTAPARSAA